MTSSNSVAFSPEIDIPSLRGKVLLVTGGNTGLGRESVLQLARHEPEEIWLTARSIEKAQEAIKGIQSQLPTASTTKIKLLVLELDSFESIFQAASHFTSHASRLDILMLNAGLVAPPGQTKDGYELQFGTNHLGHALLTRLLMPTLLNTAAKPNVDVRIVVLTSDSHNFVPKEGIDFNSLTTDAAKMADHRRYGQSKLANILFAKDMAQRYSQITTVAVHPGMVSTSLGRDGTSSNVFLRGVFHVVIGIARWFAAANVSTGAKNQLWAATADGLKSGEYYVPVGVTGRGSKLTEDVTLRHRLREWTETQLENYQGSPTDDSEPIYFQGCT